jgi:sphingomyelin phosphodiesterase acid-like 3
MTGKKRSGWVALLCGILSCLGTARAVPLPKLPQPHPVQVLFLSDLHFDPYRDPAKVPALRAAAVMQWPKILADPDSLTQAKDYSALQTACHARGMDSSWSVVDSSLKEAHKQEADPLFITVSGDLLVHNFDCRLKTLDPSATAADVSAFAAKTIEFLATSLRLSFPGVPVYMALGNNDSGCANYHQNPGSAFVKQTDASIATEFSSRRYEKTALKAFSDRGDYAVLLPRSMAETRLIVLQDVYASPAYSSCDGQGSTDARTAQVAWLREQLQAAHKLHQKVWVMAHIPPGVDTYASFHKYVSSPDKLCSVTAPTMMMQSDTLAQTMLEYAPEVKLAIFAHTHMDEMKLLRATGGAAIGAKLVPSISPVNGNHPAFILAKVQPNTAVMTDYTVYAAEDAQATAWKEEYRFSQAYRQPDFSSRTVATLATKMADDKAGEDELSQTYQRWFLPGDDGSFARGLKAVWPGYACAVTEDGGTAFQDCLCGRTGGTAVETKH